MTRSEIARLGRRVDTQDENLRVVADTVVDIKDVVDGHSTTLDEHTARHDGHSATLAEHTARHDGHSATLAEHSAVLAEHTTTLAEHSATLAEHTATLAEHTAMLREILRRLPPPDPAS